jgi:hypothetical protein
MHIQARENPSGPPPWKRRPLWLSIAFWLGPPLAVLLAVLWLWNLLAQMLR